MNTNQKVMTLIVAEAYSSSKDRYSLLPKEVGIYRDNNTNAAAGDLPSTVKSLTIVQGTEPDKHVISSREIFATHIHTYKGVPYRPAQAQVLRIANWTFDIDKTYYIIVQQKLPTYDFTPLSPRWLFTFKPLAGETLATFLTRIATTINASRETDFGREKKFTVTATATYLEITAATPYNTEQLSWGAGVYEHIGGYDCSNEEQTLLAITTEITPYLKSNGDCLSMLEQEAWFKGYLGHDNRRGFPVVADTNYIECPKCYDLIVIEYTNTYESQATGQQTFVPKPLLLVIAIPTTSTAAATSILAVLNPYMAATVHSFSPATV